VTAEGSFGRCGSKFKRPAAVKEKAAGRAGGFCDDQAVGP